MEVPRVHLYIFPPLQLNEALPTAVMVELYPPNLIPPRLPILNLKPFFRHILAAFLAHGVLMFTDTVLEGHLTMYPGCAV